MSVENEVARVMRNSGPARFFVPAGIVLILFGILLFAFNTNNYIETSGLVLEVTESVNTEDRSTQYDVKVSYTVDGKTYIGDFSGLSHQYQVGEAFTVLYDPASPNKATNSKTPSFVGPIVIGVGVLVVIYGIYATVKAFKKSKALDRGVPAGADVNFDGFKTAPDVTEYYFRFDGHSLKPGYLIEDAGRNILFEGKMAKQALVGARSFEFVNHVTGSTAEHAVGHTMTQTYNDETFFAKSWFKFDGKNVWDVIHEKGIRISTDLHSKFPYCIYDVTQNGAAFARIESSSIYVHEDEEAEHKLIVPTGNMYYRFWTDSKDFESLFLTIFAISETEQTVVE